jgi:hypothetical protein
LTTTCSPSSTRAHRFASQQRQRLGAAVDDGDLVVAAAAEQAGDGLADVAGSEQDQAHEVYSDV